MLNFNTNRWLKIKCLKQRKAVDLLGPLSVTLVKCLLNHLYSFAVRFEWVIWSIIDSKAKTNIFAKNYNDYSNFTPILIPIFNQVMPPIFFRLHILLQVLSTLNINKLTGSDEIHTILFKNYTDSWTLYITVYDSQNNGIMATLAILWRQIVCSYVR